MDKIIVAGCRDYKDQETIFRTLDLLLKDQEVEIVSGGARGVDTIGELWATLRGQECKVFKAEWNKYGKSAGYKRNEEMAEYADQLIAFWDGKSKGTKHMIDLAEEHALRVRLILFDEES